MSPTYPFAINYLNLNFQNPAIGAVFQQLYVREAMQSLVDQPGYISTVDKGYGIPTTGPVPTVPSTYASKLELTGAYPFNPAKAKRLLQSNGWTGTRPGSTATCTAGACAAAGLAGRQLAFTLFYNDASTLFTQQMTDLADELAQAGIRMTATGEDQATILATAGKNCFVTGNCSWEAAALDTGWEFDPDFLPTGEDLFAGQAGCSSAGQLAEADAGGYCDATNDANILATTEATSLSAIHTYENYLARQLPVLWLPTAGHLTEISNFLEGVTPQSLFGALTPEKWGWETGHVPPS